MSPFFQFRLWLERATAASKASSAAAAAIVVALLVWIAVPSNSSPISVTSLGGGTSSQGSGGSGSVGSAGSSGSGGATSGSAPASATGSGTAPASSTGTGSSGPVASSGAPAATGASSGAAATASTVPRASNSTPAGAGTASCSGRGAPFKLGVVLVEVGSGSASLNGTFGVPQPSEQQADFQAVMDTINKAGGIACHPVQGDYQTYNELDSSSATSACLTFVQNHDFAVLNGFLPQASDVCPLQNHLPVFEEILIPGATVKQYYPDYFSIAGELDVVMKNAAQALGHMGYFGSAKGFKKLGVFYRDCIAGEYQTWIASVEAAGVPASAISGFDVGCPNGFAAPSTDEQAVLQFQQAGVTTVSPINESTDLQEFTKAAQAQGFHPQYVLPDDGTVATSGSPTFEPDPTNFNGAIAITPDQYGAIGSNLPETAATKTCDQIMTSHGLPTVYKSGDQYAGAVCNQLWAFQAAASHDPSLTQTGLAAGLDQAGSVAMSFPDGPNNFSAPGTTTGGQYWRPVSFHSSCGCWMVNTATFQPSYS